MRSTIMRMAVAVLTPIPILIHTIMAMKITITIMFITMRMHVLVIMETQTRAIIIITNIIVTMWRVITVPPWRTPVVNIATTAVATNIITMAIWNITSRVEVTLIKIATASAVSKDFLRFH
jgi:hypothetical protein